MGQFSLEWVSVISIVHTSSCLTLGLYGEINRVVNVIVDCYIIDEL